MEDVVQDLYNSFIKEVNKYIREEENIRFISKAFSFAYEAHKGQTRKSNEPYIIHALNVALILAQMKVGPKTIAAGLLHDVIEDTIYELDDITKEFGEEVANLVESVTKINNLTFQDEKEYLAVNHRKIFIAMAKDIRVILIKLVDRLHNMRTLQFMSNEKQMKIASETLEVYAPIAHRLGINEIKNELEDLSFRYLYPDKYFELAKLVENRKNERDEQVQDMIKEISNLLNENKLYFRIFGRSKHLYSIHKKMTTKNKRFEEILDLLAIRIVTKDVNKCYEILGHIHAKYMPIPGRFKDYIAMPKVNMYQSLHTTIVAQEGNIFEIQIRTESMDDIAEMGIAAHWRYKEGVSTGKEIQQELIEEQLHWFKEFSKMSTEIDDDALEYMNLITKDIFEANVYVMSPKGRVIALPNGSTPIDFAYRIHTEIGHHTVGATVNGVLVALNTILKTGDVVSIRTSKQSTGPSEDWNKIVKSTHARNKIKSFFVKQEIEKRALEVKKGEEMLADELKRRGYNVEEYMDQKKLESLLTHFSYTNYVDMMYAVSIKALPLVTLIEKLTKHKSNIFHDNEIVSRIFNKSASKKITTNKTGIVVPGVDSMMVTLAACCDPVYGDEIVGYISKGQGVKVHRSNCPNIIKEKKRIIDVQWDENFENKSYKAKLNINSNDRNYLLSDIVTVIAQCKANIVHIDSKINDDKITTTTKLEVGIKDLDHLNILIANLKKINSVQTIERIIL